MKVYSHQGCGHYIGSCVVVVAEDADKAELRIRDILDLNGLEREEVNITEFTTDQEAIVVDINGDY